MLNARVFALGVLSDRDDVNIVVRSLEAVDRLARSHVGEQVKLSLSEKQTNVLELFKLREISFISIRLRRDLLAES